MQYHQQRTEFEIHLSLALKRVSKPLRRAFADKDWQVAEAAQKAIADHLVRELACFEVMMKPIAHPNTHQGHEPSHGSINGLEGNQD